jgi:Acyl-CoA carboxylase epsilon subunit
VSAEQERGVDGITVDVLRGAPTDTELAALVAVVSEAYVEEAAGALADEGSARSAWSVSQRTFREPLDREIGWGRFGS